jgi:hypothetical protein
LEACPITLRYCHCNWDFCFTRATFSCICFYLYVDPPASNNRGKGVNYHDWDEMDGNNVIELRPLETRVDRSSNPGVPTRHRMSISFPTVAVGARLKGPVTGVAEVETHSII